MTTHQCDTCGKSMTTPKLDKCAGGLEGYIARNQPQHDKAYCSDECYVEREL